MDAAARRQVLVEKAKSNHQRRQREELLNRLPPHLANILGECICIYSVEMDQVVRRFLPFNSSGIGAERVMPPQYHCVEVAWESEMFDLAARLVVPRDAGKAFLLLNPSADVRFGAPVFVVDFQWAAPLLKELWPYSTGGLFLVEQDLQAGLLIDTYIGYLSEDLNPREIVYEVALWPTAPEVSEA